MNYNFVEIGTPVDPAMMEYVNDSVPGIYVEALQENLDRAQDKQKVVKVAAHVAWQPNQTQTTLYYIPDADIEAAGLDLRVFKAYTSVEAPHPAHVSANVLHLVEKRTVPVKSLQQIFTENAVDKVGILKLQTQGKDCEILLNSASYLASKTNKPIKIEVNTNGMHTELEKVEEVIAAYQGMGYTVTYRDPEKLVLERPI